MLNSGLVNPVAGFGNACKLKLSRTGYQLMAQFGGYSEYMASLKAQQQQPTIILPGIDPNNDDNDCAELTDDDGEPTEE